MLKPLTILKLPGLIRSKFQSIGCEYVEDIEEAIINYDEASTRLNKLISENNVIEKIQSDSGFSNLISAANLWHKELCTPSIVIFHKGLNKLLDGGLPVGRITELCGSPGCGKTQMCIQFCVDVQIPSVFGGSSGKALYISTDYGLDIERLQEISSASIKHFSGVECPNKKEILTSFSVDTLLNGVSVWCPHDINNFMKVVTNLDSFFTKNENIKLLIIDSFSFLFVTEVQDLLYRTKIIAEVLDILQNLAIKFKIAVVLTNQLMTLLTSTDKARLKPSLGEGFGHKLHQRLLLDKGKIYLTKSVNRSQMFTNFEITKDGIR